jgi:hypothetical protein
MTMCQALQVVVYESHESLMRGAGFRSTLEQEGEFSGSMRHPAAPIAAQKHSRANHSMEAP